MPNTVLCEKIGSLRVENCLIFFRTELFEAYIVLKTLLIDLPETIQYYNKTLVLMTIEAILE